MLTIEMYLRLAGGKEEDDGKGKRKETRDESYMYHG